MFSQGHRDCLQTAGEVMGAARSHEPGSTMATAGQEGRSSARYWPRFMAGSQKGFDTNDLQEASALLKELNY